MRKSLVVALVLVAAASVGSAQTTLQAWPPPANNGGSAGWAMFMDLLATAPNIVVTELVTASTAAANANFNIEVFTYNGSCLGGPVGQGPGSSPAGWTSLGVVQATQGSAGSTGVSLPVDIPDIVLTQGQTTGVALLFTVAGPRYYGAGTPAYSVFSDANLTLTTGDARSAPFTTGGSFFASRALVGSVTYVPEPGALALLAVGLLCARRGR